MADAFMVAVDGLSALDEFDELPKRIERWAYQAINTTTRRERTASAREIGRQVNFPPGYLGKSGGRLSITKMARRGDLEAEITGRHRPTSLARFATRGTPKSTRRQGGVSVAVKRGREQFMHRAFLMHLKAGAAGIETKSNLGLAIRLKPGERLRNKQVMAKKIGSDPTLYLLYGPSVDQVFDDVAEDHAPKVADFLETEFLRLTEL